jgi:antitoxin ParD1/3/4
MMVAKPKAPAMPSSYTLGDHFEDFVRGLVESGRYASASEVIRDSLRLLEDQERLRDLKLNALRSEIREGLESGSGAPLDMAEIKEAARRERAARQLSAGHVE